MTDERDVERLRGAAEARVLGLGQLLGRMWCNIVRVHIKRVAHKHPDLDGHWLAEGGRAVWGQKRA